MIQFNLLPDVKMQYVKAKRTKRLIISTSTLVSIVCVGVILLLFSVVQIAQKKHISDLSSDIADATKKIQSIDGLDNILTVQNQLTLLPDLHEAKPKTSRLFDYLAFVSPTEAKIVSLNFDAATSTIVLQGTADKIATVNKLVDNIKATTYSIEGQTTGSSTAPFTQVSTQLSGDNEKASYKIDLVYDPIIFQNTKEIIMQLEGQSFSTKSQESL